ncbi:MAG: glycosyltransferase family 39 protein [Chloroflexi bacterium]|nr:glycosyltransferase family 39 protein [Chloroflexota bacterium]
MDQAGGSRGKRWWIRRICAGIIGLHLSLLAYGAWVHSPTIDEVGHMAAGVSHWELGRFDLYRVNPPLVRLIAALPVSVVGYKMDWRGYSDAAGSRSEFYLGEKFAELNGGRSFRLFTLARLGSMVFSILGAVVCLLWARDLFGDASGVMALVLWCFSPMILGHGQMITPDVGATALGLAACYCFRRWLRAPDWYRAYLTGLVLGLAQLTKATMVLFFPLFPLLWLLWVALSSPKSQQVPLRRSAAQLALCLALALIVLNAGYGFEGTFQKLEDYRFVSESLVGQSQRPSNRFADTWLAEVPVPLPVNYVMGVDTQKRDFEQGIRSYLRGTWQPHGWWYYYLYGLLVKTPGGVLALAILAVAWATFCRSGRATLRDELFLAIPPTLIFVLVSSQTGFNHHLRYVLPVYPFLFVSMLRRRKLADRIKRPTDRII